MRGVGGIRFEKSTIGLIGAELAVRGDGRYERYLKVPLPVATRRPSASRTSRLEKKIVRPPPLRVAVAVRRLPAPDRAVQFDSASLTRGSGSIRTKQEQQ